MSEPSSARSQRSSGSRGCVPEPIRVAVVDDHEILRNTLRLVLVGAPDMEWVGEAQDGAEALDLVVRTLPDVVLMDLIMPGTDGLQATQTIVGACSSTRVLVLTSSTDPAHVRLSLGAGASGVLTKDGNPATILTGIRSVVRGEQTGPTTDPDS
ncbi:hypothetical protein GCM10023168_19280 [Fodinibacter luteus]|uniref:Response regulatory domain-containing protein n=1 Tax=Fodinibacter luteus TaxID=552064 RepID=A0ABP8KFS0_9MICO